MRLPFCFLCFLIVLALPAAALAAPNPADELSHLPIAASVCDKHVDATVAHRDHVGMTRAGAQAKTSFWRRHTG